MLALSPNGRRARGWLQDKLCSTASDQRGAASLRQELSALRKHFERFGASLLETAGEDIVMNPARNWVDARDGTPAPHRELLEGIDVGDPEFEIWLSEERAFWYGRLDTNSQSASLSQQSSIEPRRLFPHLALSPFLAIGKAVEAEDFVAGLMEELHSLLHALMGTYRIVVAQPRNSQQADFVLEGSVQSQDGIIRIYGRLLDLRNRTQIWSARHSLKPNAGLLDRDKLARSIVEAVQATLSDGKWTDYWAGSSTSTEAWELFQKGRVREAAARRTALHEAIAYYRAAIQSDPDFLQPHISLGFCLIDGLRMCLHGAPAAAAREAAAIAEDVALRVPHNVYGRALRAFVLCAEGNCKDAIGIMREVVKSAPRSPELIAYLAAVHGYCGDYDSEQLLYRNALSLSPFPPVWIRTNLAFSRLLSDCVVEEDLLKVVLDEDPDNPRALIAETVRLVRAGKADSARAVANRLLQVDPDFQASQWRAKVFVATPAAHRRVVEDLCSAGLA